MRFEWLFIGILALLSGYNGVVHVIARENLRAYPIVETNQTSYFNDSTSISELETNSVFYGQDACYTGNTPEYSNNEDGTVSDLITGLMWQQTCDHNSDGSIDSKDKLSYKEIITCASKANTGGYTDWRVPTCKELYSLMMFSGRDISTYQGTQTDKLRAFINTNYFGFNYGNSKDGEQLTDVQCASANLILGCAKETVFGVNFAEGRIKGYETSVMGQTKRFNYLLVRGNTSYGKNSFSNNKNGTITDKSTGLMWMQDDYGSMNWQEALVYAENSEYGGYSDWRLPNAKELQSIVDYTHNSACTNSAAIDTLFNCSEIINETGETDYPYYWTSTTHAILSDKNEGVWAVLFAFGSAIGNESKTNNLEWIDVHNAGVQYSDPKAGDPNEYSKEHRTQGNTVRIYNYIRLVRNAE
jgi:hypothetical protein